MNFKASPFSSFAAIASGSADSNPCIQASNINDLMRGTQMTNMLLQSERLVIESFLKQASAALTMFENIDSYGVARVVKSATSRDVNPEEFDEVLDSLFHTDDDFRGAKRALKRAVAKVEYALDVDAQRKDDEADRKSQEASLDELVGRWEAEVKLASPVRAVNEIIKRMREDAFRSAYREEMLTHLRNHGLAIVGVAPHY
ncbi:hypothetical protein GFM44_23385 [Rhizobium leguminosarum bv. viciae]|nr:hypothetical protein [Rhizobium leguminosarum bv. viciae]